MRAAWDHAWSQASITASTAWRWVGDSTAIRLLAQEEGIIPALETSHAVHAAVQLARTMPKDAIVVINVSGRGDKDVNEVIRLRGG